MSPLHFRALLLCSAVVSASSTPPSTLVPLTTPPLQVLNTPPPARGIFDPSLLATGDAAAPLLLAYSAVDATANISTRLAVFAPSLNAFVSVSHVNAASVNVSLPCEGGVPCAGSLVHEVPTLVADPLDPDASRALKIFAHTYAVTSGDTLRYDWGHISLFTAPTPQGPWLETPLLGWASSSPLSAVGQDLSRIPALSDCLLFTEPAALLLPNASLLLALGCASPPTPPAPTPPIRIILLSSHDHAVTWSYVGLLVDGEHDAEALGSSVPQVDAADLFLSDEGGVFLSLSTSGEIRPGFVGYIGCTILQLTPTFDAVIRGAEGTPVVERTIAPASPAFAGACTVATGGSALPSVGGYLLPILDLDTGIFTIRPTGVAPVEAISTTTGAAVPPTCDGPFTISPTSLRPLDACGRERDFRGYNVVDKGEPYIASRVRQPSGQSLAPEDTALWRSIGANLVRLGIMWEGVVPHERGVVNETLTAAYASMSAAIYAEAGVFTLLDAHQDGFSPYFCDDGAPSWAAREYSAGAPGFPSPIAPTFNNTPGGDYDCSGGGSIPWAEYYFTSAVGLAFKTLYTTPTGQADYAAFWTAVIAAYAASSDAGAGVLAMELMNEPWAGDVLADPLLLIPGVADGQMLQPFFANITLALRAAETAVGAPHRIVALEPSTFDNFVPAGFTPARGLWDLALLSYHYYALPDVIGATWQVEARAADALRLGAWGLLTEFDMGLLHPVVAPYTELDLRATLAACDAVGHGYIGWVYGSLFDSDTSADSDTLLIPAVREMARPIPFALAGSNATWAFDVRDPLAPSFSLNYTHNASIVGGGVPLPSLVFLSTGLWFPADRMHVTVESDPPSAVTWVLDAVDGAVALPAGNATRAPPVPFAYATLSITAAAGVTGLARVTVRVDVAPVPVIGKFGDRSVSE